jgi:hypothetical protein
LVLAARSSDFFTISPEAVKVSIASVKDKKIVKNHECLKKAIGSM